MTPKQKGCLLLTLICAVGLSVALAGLAFLALAQPATRPTVLIQTPHDGARVQIGTDTSIRAVARDESKIKRVELWVDGTLVDADSSEAPGGISPFPVQLNWRPTISQAHTVTVRAFNSRGERSQGSIDVRAVEIADQDRDGVPDTADACPDEPGSMAARGCPDQDGDGVKDAADKCPSQPGLAAAGGCPAPAANDRDGDGLLDPVDKCPDQVGPTGAQGCPDGDNDGTPDSTDVCPREPGSPDRSGCPTPGDADGDGVVDASDACPAMVGTAALGGCPDGDGDGVRDGDDACPDTQGPAATGGCPDRDGDGVRDAIDLCASVAGPAANAGCPASAAGDQDGDGVRDDVDLSPAEPGLAQQGGVPPPGAGADSNGNGIPEAEEPAWAPVQLVLSTFVRATAPTPKVAVPLEVQAIELEVSPHHYDRIACRATLGTYPENEYGPFDALGENQWDIAAYLGGENGAHLTADDALPFDVSVNCHAYTYASGDGTAATTYTNLGSFVQHHNPQTDWDGRIFQSISRGGAAGHWFSVKYLMCRGSCQETAFPAPVLAISHGADDLLVWDWSGNRADIDEFRVYLNGTRIQRVPDDQSSLGVARSRPECHEMHEFYIVAYRLQGAAQSPPSNTVTWENDTPCPRLYRVSFDTLVTKSFYEVPFGPIAGDVWANDKSLTFDACDSNRWCHQNGMWLMDQSTYDLDAILGQIYAWLTSCLGAGCPDYWAPEDNEVIVSLEQGDDLSFGIHLDQVGCIGGSLTMRAQEYPIWGCDPHRTIASSDLAPGVYTATSDECDLRVTIEDLGLGH